MAWCAGRRKCFLLLFPVILPVSISRAYYYFLFRSGFYFSSGLLFLTAKPELAVTPPVKSEDFTYPQQNRVDFSTPADALRNVIDARIVTFTHPPVNDKATVSHTNIEMSQ